MSELAGRGVQRARVKETDANTRLDRWLRRRIGSIPQSRLEGLLRRGRIRVEGRRARAGQRLGAGEEVSWPDDLRADTPRREQRQRRVDPKLQARMMRTVAGRIIYEDDWFVAVDKPAGLAVQGGSKQRLSLDMLLSAWFTARAEEGVGDTDEGELESPRLLHRLDRGTSGVVLFARHSEAARVAMESFRCHEVFKVYWALVAGVPAADEGRMDWSLSKGGSVGGQKMRVDDSTEAKSALTYWVKVATLGGVSWLALSPVTGRMHQLRVHLSTLGVPVIGDGKYGGRAAFAPFRGEGRGRGQGQGEGEREDLVADGPLLFARHLRLSDGRGGGGMLRLTAPLPLAFVAALEHFSSVASVGGGSFGGEGAVERARAAEARLLVVTGSKG